MIALMRHSTVLLTALACLVSAAPAIASASTPAPAATAAPAASPAPTPTATPTPSASLGYIALLGSFHTNGVNATGALDQAGGVDLASRTDFNDLFLNASAGTGKLRASALIGEYSIPTLGFALNPALQSGANTRLFGVVPIGSLQYSFNDRWSAAAGKFGALLGQESPMTFQNVNIQRGLAWALEPTISRGMHVSYAQGPWSGTLEYNDAYYSGHDRAWEALVGYAPTSNTNIQFAAIVPSANAGPNPTVTIGNKTEYDLFPTRTIGKLQLMPYVLWVRSPASGALGYPRDESAFAAVLMGAYSFNSDVSVAARWEQVNNHSATTDASPNADLVGFGPGSGGTTFTVTPTYHHGVTLVRLEYSHMTVQNATPGLAFGSAGTDTTQNRIGLEVGVQH